jgi:hypothetical protein
VLLLLLLLLLEDRLYVQSFQQLSGFSVHELQYTLLRLLPLPEDARDVHSLQ